MAAIVGIVTSLLGPAIELGKCIVVPIKRQFNYLCCFSSNIQNLRDEAKKLDDARTGLQMEVTAAENNAEVIDPRVESWLKDVNEIQVKINGIESEITKIQSGCLTVKSRFSLSKRAKKTGEFMKELRGNCKFNPLSHPAQPAATVPIPLGSTLEFQSRKHIEEDIMSTLRAEKVNMMGICGMGGVGKTTMAKRIKKRVMEEHLFDETVMVVVSQQVNMLKIQLEIAEQLGLKLEEETLSTRAHKLRSRLEGRKRILIILDDVWRYLNREDLGIPCENGLKGCAILLTSRDRDVFNKMDIHKIFEIQTLADIEAWSLFQEKVGTCVDDQNLLSVAQEVMKECKGLPIALVTVGVALKNKRKSIWEDALQQLRSSNPTNLSDVLTEVYNPLKLSYDFLDDEQARSIFLLCSLFREDHHIPLEYLTFYAVGLCMFEEIENLGQARNRTCSLVEMLRSRFLLLDGKDENNVRMHDVIRDVAIFIASKERRLIKCSDKCTWISSYLGERIRHSNGSRFPNLRLLLIDKKADIDSEINDNFFEGLTKLNVLSIRRFSLRSLPHSTQLLKDLRTLILYSCESLETISVVSELVYLEILICFQCKLIKELPIEIRRLNCMRLLDISYCHELKTIAPGIISRLVRLEKLKMVKSFNKWESDDNEEKERKNVGLRELESLSDLTWLEIEVDDFALAAKEIHISQKIVNFGISIGDHELVNFPSHKGLEKRINLHLPKDITLGNWILKFWSSFEHMRLVGEGLSNLNLEQALQNLRSLTLKECSKVKKLGNNVFRLLESLELEKLANLEEICDIDGLIPNEGPTSGNDPLQNLKELRLVDLPALKHLRKSGPYQTKVVSLFNNLSFLLLWRCHSIRNLFSLSMSAKDCLLQLEKLEISSCKRMEQVFVWNEEENEKNDTGSESRCGSHTKIFPKLEELRLWDLPRLKTFCKGIESIEFPLLTFLIVGANPQLKSLVSSRHGINQKNSGGNTHDQDGDDDSLHLFCKPEEVAFDRVRELSISGYNNIVTLWCHHIPIDFLTGLEHLKISNYHKIKSLFSSSVAENLVNLKYLEIESYNEMVKVIDDDEDKDACQTTTRLFPRLEFLRLDCLSKLEIFCGWRCALELPSLQSVEIVKCPKMERFSFASLTTPNLKQIKDTSWSPEIIIKSKELNGGVQQLLFKVKEKEEKRKREEEEDNEKQREEEQIKRKGEIEEMKIDFSSTTS